MFVDLFGGSGLLSHITKCVRTDATVVYNDFDNYRCRLVNIPATNVRFCPTKGSGADKYIFLISFCFKTAAKVHRINEKQRET